MSLILCGFFCAGKTTLGKLCAENLGLPFVDTDRLIEEMDGGGKEVSVIWQEKGMQWFRDLETKVILSLKKEPAVVATGGGSLLREVNRSYLKELGMSVYLKASPQILYQRLLKRGFPAFLDKNNPFEHFHRLFSERFPIYESHCEYMIETQDSSEQELVEHLSLYYGQQ